MKDTLNKKDIRRKARSIRDRVAFGVMVALGTAVASAATLLGPQVRTAGAQDFQTAAVNGRIAEPSASGPISTPAAPRRAGLAGRYFVDFRARTAASYGHAFVWYGRLNEHGKVGKIEVAGLHPASDSPIPYILGHIIPVPAETGKSYGDLDEQYLTANYRVYLSEADAKKVFAYIQHKQASTPLWWNGVYNCTAFIADIAAFMGLKTPPTATWMYPETMVNTMKQINGGRQEAVLAASTH
jgi:hypothetical protein